MISRRMLLRHSRAFTLVELLVAMAIVIVFASITALFLPDILRSDKQVAGADMIQNMLLIARQHAIRDQVPFGVRFYTNPDPVVSSRTICTEMAYVEQPDDYVIPTDAISSVSAATSTTPGKVAITSNITGMTTTTDFSGGVGAQVAAASVSPEDFPVQRGDYLMINYPGGIVSMITDVSQTSTGAMTNPYNVLTVLNPGNYTTTSGSYGIIRAPRRVRGEDSVKLPTDIVIVISDPKSVGVGCNPVSTVDGPTAPTMPTRTVTVSVNGTMLTSTTASFSEIVFGPTGSVIGTNGNSTPASVIKIWVWDSSRDSYTDGQPLYVVVSPLTGRIAIQPVNVSGPPSSYDSYVTDLSNSGM